MKTLITIDEVRSAVLALKSAGRKVTLASIHAQLGHRGSMTTLVKLKAQIDAPEEQSGSDSPEALEAFREVWALAMEQGRCEGRERLAAAQDAQDALSGEVSRLEAQAIDLQKALADAAAQKDSLLAIIQQEREMRDKAQSERDRLARDLYALKEQREKPVLFSATGDRL